MRTLRDLKTERGRGLDGRQRNGEEEKFGF